MDARLLFPSLYLAAPDLHGKDVTLTMRALVVEDLESKQGSEKKGIIYFEETKAKADKAGTKEKRLVLNKTNMKSIAKMHGFEADNWPGKRITLFPTTTAAFGETVDCIRVRDVAPKATAKKGEGMAGMVEK